MAYGVRVKKIDFIFPVVLEEQKHTSNVKDWIDDVIEQERGFSSQQICLQHTCARADAHTCTHAQRTHTQIQLNLYLFCDTTWQIFFGATATPQLLAEVLSQWSLTLPVNIIQSTTTKILWAMTETYVYVTYIVTETYIAYTISCRCLPTYLPTLVSSSETRRQLGTSMGSRLRELIVLFHRHNGWMLSLCLPCKSADNQLKRSFFPLLCLWSPGYNPISQLLSTINQLTFKHSCRHLWHFCSVCARWEWMLPSPFFPPSSSKWGQSMLVTVNHHHNLCTPTMTVEYVWMTLQTKVNWCISWRERGGERKVMRRT